MLLFLWDTLSIDVNPICDVLVDRFELICQTIEYEKKYQAKKDLKEFFHVRKGIKNEFVKKWVEDVLREREAFWKAMGLESVVRPIL